MKRKILIVDDSYYMRTMLKNMLIDAGHEVVGEASNGEEAMSLATSLKPELITLDLILPDTTGLEILKKLKEQNLNSKVIMVSAVGQEMVVNEAIENGAQAYIVKPFNEANALEVIDSLFE